MTRTGLCTHLNPVRVSALLGVLCCYFSESLNNSGFLFGVQVFCCFSPFTSPFTVKYLTALKFTKSIKMPQNHTPSIIIHGPGSAIRFTLAGLRRYKHAFAAAGIDIHQIRSPAAFRNALRLTQRTQLNRLQKHRRPSPCLSSALQSDLLDAIIAGDESKEQQLYQRIQVRKSLRII